MGMILFFLLMRKFIRRWWHYFWIGMIYWWFICSKSRNWRRRNFFWWFVPVQIICSCSFLLLLLIVRMALLLWVCLVERRLNNLRTFVSYWWRWGFAWNRSLDVCYLRGDFFLLLFFSVKDWGPWNGSFVLSRNIWILIAIWLICSNWSIICLLITSRLEIILILYILWRTSFNFLSLWLRCILIILWLILFKLHNWNIYLFKNNTVFIFF